METAKDASAWYAHIEAANIQAAEDAERALVTALAKQVGNAVTAMPEAATRIAKAASIVQQARCVAPDQRQFPGGQPAGEHRSVPGHTRPRLGLRMP